MERISPEFSATSTAFVGSLTLELSTGLPAGEIRYTFDGSLPDSHATRYEGPLELTTVTRVRARTFAEGKLPSQPVTHVFLAMEAEAYDLRSDLPVIP